jgi:hypothetical protein
LEPFYHGLGGKPPLHHDKMAPTLLGWNHLIRFTLEHYSYSNATLANHLTPDSKGTLCLSPYYGSEAWSA